MKQINEFNEFTWDMVRTLPHAYYYHINKIPYKVNCKPSLSSLYFFVENKNEVNRFNDQNDTSTYNFERPPFTKKEWLPPPLKEIFKGKFQFKKPVVVIQNKFTLEWQEGVFNFFKVEFLEEVFKYLRDKYDIVYIRPESNTPNYYTDENKILEFDDYKVIEERHPYVITMKHLLKTHPKLDYNTLQYYTSASSSKHLTTSGGNACVASYFGGDVIIFDSPKGKGAGRGIWKTDSWLKDLGGAKILGFNDYESILKTIKDRW